MYRSWRVGRDCTGARVLGENVPELEVLRVRRGYRGGMSGSCMKEKCCSRVGERISLKATEDVSWSLSQHEKHAHTDLFSFILLNFIFEYQGKEGGIVCCHREILIFSRSSLSTLSPFLP